MKKIISIFIVAVLIIVSSAIFYQSGKKAGQEESIKQSAEQIASLQQNLEAFFPPLPESLNNVLGKITKIESGAFYFEASYKVKRFPQTDGSEKQILTKKVKISPTTEIVKSDFEAPITEEMPGVPEIKLSLNNLQIGQQVYISTKENILEKDEFIADRIQTMEIF